jgi:glycosyltransferase involved in cell wall biosynthesis
MRWRIVDIITTFEPRSFLRHGSHAIVAGDGATQGRLPAVNIVLSYGDLSRAGGYRSRVLGELQALDRVNGADPFLLVFDRNPGEFKQGFHLNAPHRALPRSSVLQFYPAIASLAAQSSIGLVHAHNLYSAALALSHRWRYRYKVVLDYHGRIPEEYVFLGKGGAGSRKTLELLEGWCVRSSDHVVTVSHKLSDYIQARYEVPERKLSVIPCCADDRLFTFDAARRDAVRHSLNLAGKFVCTHLGSFFEWYDPDMVVNVFERIRRQVDAHLLVVTADREHAAAYLGTRLPAEAFSVRSAAHEEVPGLLNASDIGLLLLRSSPNIKTSSPVKFAEYLNCGLPVLITPEVGDYSHLVVAQGVGAVVSWSGEFDPSIVTHGTTARTALAEQCSAAGKELTWRMYSPTWSEIASKHGS